PLGGPVLRPRARAPDPGARGHEPVGERAKPEQVGLLALRERRVARPVARVLPGGVDEERRGRRELKLQSRAEIAGLVLVLGLRERLAPRPPPRRPPSLD